ncbi:aminomethyltransferase family protein [Halorarius halobius]|uniref:CAF17-like 4Fe-4S cluster assembly/insertion protein YgfZ n=1 Tax=Halorarius halobius TaxID=2962671 RepID=UPI0020CDED3D|nr:aminomethyltransferase family protein [Halorarius halobius]
MTVVPDTHERHGATFAEHDGRRVVEEYGRPERTHRAVRNGVGVIEMGYGVLELTGEDRVEFVDNAVSNRVPSEDGRGVYALLLDPQGAVRTDLYVYNAGERLLCFTPPAQAGPLAEEWRENTFIQDVEIREASTDFGVFGVHGPTSTEKVASVLNGAASPDGHLTFVRGSMGDAGVTVVASDAPTGEEGYEVVCAADAAEEVFDTLLTRGMNAVPFGHRTWNTLTLEAGTPLFATELEGQVPNVLGLRNALDFEKGCYVGQEVVSKIENRGRPSRRLVGLAVDAVPDAGAAVFAGDDHAGEVTRAVDSPTLEEPLALALVDYGADIESATVRVDGEEREATRRALPFVEGSDTSARLPTYD